MNGELLLHGLMDQHLSCHLELEDEEEEDFVFGYQIKPLEPLLLLGSTECEVSSL